jgi:hypothetical protein
MEWDYLEPKDIEVARANGISYMNAYNRVYNLGWPVEKAITTPIRDRSNCLWYQWRDTCKKHNVTQNSFYQRLYAGWTPEEASTLPLGTILNKKAAIITKSLMALAAEKGISRFTLHARIHRYKWSVEKALNTPVMTQYRRKS